MVVMTGGTLGFELVTNWGSSWRLYIMVTTGGTLGLELAAIDRDNHCKDTGAGAARVCMSRGGTFSLVNH